MNMMLGTLCLAIVAGCTMAPAWADPVALRPEQMDAITAGSADAYATSQANANGRAAFTGTLSSAVGLNGLLLRLSGYGGGSLAAAMAAATGPSAHLDISAQAGYGAAGNATAQAAADGTTPLAAISAGVVSVSGQPYLVGGLVAGAGAGAAVATAPIALSTAAGLGWSPPTTRTGARGPLVSVTSADVQGGQQVTYTLAAGDTGGNASPGGNGKMSLSFFKPPRSRIPLLLPLDISGVVPVLNSALQAKPVAM
jgi:hypothetical protein